MRSSTLRAFVSSRTVELHNERAVVKEALAQLGIDAFVFEGDAGARPESAQHAFLDEVQASDLYVGMFWNEHSSPVALEFHKARELGKPCLLYIKEYAVDRDATLATFLRDVRHPLNGVTVRTFNTVLDLASAVKADVQAWLVRDWRHSTHLGVPNAVQRQRLQADARLLADLVKESKSLDILVADGDPPTRYLIRFVAMGVVALREDDQPVTAEEHLVEMVLHGDYPMSLPFVKFLTPIVHPNVYSSGTVCLGWFTVPYSLSAVALRILSMIRMTDYNLTSPSNMEARRWLQSAEGRTFLEAVEGMKSIDDA